MDFVASYLRESGRVLRDGETLAYGCWITKFVARDPKNLDTWEFDSSATAVVPGATLALTYWRDQHEICGRVGTDFDPPAFDSLVVVSQGVLLGEAPQGVRYPSPAEMSGWWITADDYNGDIKTLRTEHLYHVTDLRPDLARYLALPCGFRFDLSNYEDVWLDRAVADQPVI